MLISLNISNVAIIDRLEIEFGTGLNLLSGETGAGKSIIIDALGLTLGNRASAELIRSGADEALVEAIFSDIIDPAVKRIASNAGFSCDDELILRRRLRSDGSSRAYINDAQVNISTLRELGTSLVTVHGQSEGDELLGSEGQLSLLDSYAGNEDQVAKVSEVYTSVVNLEAELERVTTNERERVREIDLLEHQIGEIEGAKLELGEEEMLLQERNLLRNAERLRELSEGAFDLLYAGEDSITSSLAKVLSFVSELAQYEGSLKEKQEQIESASYQLEDAAAAIRDFLARVEADPSRLEQIELRLDSIKSLQRKYGETTAEVLSYLEKAKMRLEELRHADERAGTIRTELEERISLYEQESLILRKSRMSAIPRFEKDVMRHLSDLAMEKAKFSVQMEPHPRIRTRSGTDRVTFLISPNPGEDLKSLAKIASGGEMSRLMLAVKSCVIGPRNHATAIFDEVDSGIGGRVAEFVGRKLKRLSSEQQIICITHLPQIAIYADLHATVRKRTLKNRTEVSVTQLDGESRIEELARMLGGEEITEVTRKHARELLAQARQHAAK
jgi:DNA repair protein RecN (Recombination protein N)